MKDFPVFSVIVPIYNAELYLPRCLDSILGQSFEDFEIICINDGSPDLSYKILENYAKKDSRVKVITFTKNRGISCARNAGLEQARGKYIQFVDSDDYLDEYALRVIYDKMEKDASDICIFSYRNIRDGVRYIDYTIQDYLKNYGDNAHIFDSMDKIFSFEGYTWMRAMRRDFWLRYKIFFPEHIKLAEDMYFWTCLEYKASYISLVDGPCYNYIYYSNSFSRKQDAVERVLEAYKYTAEAMPDNFRLEILVKGYDVAKWYNSQKKYRNDSIVECYKKEIEPLLQRHGKYLKILSEDKKYWGGVVCVKRRAKKLGFFTASLVLFFLSALTTSGVFSAGTFLFSSAIS